MTRKINSGIEIGRLRLFWFKGGTWRNKFYPYWFVRNWDTVATFQSGPLEVWWYKYNRKHTTD